MNFSLMDLLPKISEIINDKYMYNIMQIKQTFIYRQIQK